MDEAERNRLIAQVAAQQHEILVLAATSARNAAQPSRTPPGWTS
ncbi:MAG: hypothetical protein ACRDRH_04490 [Pseudonocardia sp.]